ncbi:unnamed protein product [Parnassius mnemosyne]|uniref:Uncharacterized protein n=1 Tax=Parnassius mnemosyne TaxID=213953 RepID=A0AAV1LN54_9NEOP
MDLDEKLIFFVQKYDRLITYKLSEAQSMEFAGMLEQSSEFAWLPARRGEIDASIPPQCKLSLNHHDGVTIINYNLSQLYCLLKDCLILRQPQFTHKKKKTFTPFYFG